MTTTEPMVLGLRLQPLLILLTAHSPFVQEIENEDGAWASGDRLELRFDNAEVWPATMSGVIARWDKPPTDVDALIAAGAARAALWYVSGSVEQQWTTIGPVRVQP